MERSRSLFLAVFVTLGAVACSDPCGDLEEQCGSCAGTDEVSNAVEMACNQVVKMDDADVCDAALDTQAYKCP